MERFIRGAWESKPTRVIGLWFAIFLVLNWVISYGSEPGVEQAGLGLNSAIAGIAATLQWMWLERTGAGLLKALIFGGLLTLVVFVSFYVTAQNAAMP